MNAWLVTCDACPYRERFQAQAEAQQDALRHVHDNPRHRPRVTEEES
jgi:hypothetical protein